MTRPVWKLLPLVAALLWAVPLGALALQAFSTVSGSWDHLAATVLGDYLLNSALLTLGAVLVAGLTGFFSAWTSVRWNFRGKNLFIALQLLPLAVPSFLSAAALRYLMEYTGPLGTLARTWGLPWFTSPPSGLGFGIIILGFSLSPYVFLTLRPLMHRMSTSLVETAALAGWPPRRILRKVVVPLVRPGLIGGLSLVAMESLNEYGLPLLLGFPTFTTGIYQTWYGLGDLPGALRLAFGLALFWVVFFALERWARGKKDFGGAGSHTLGDNPWTASKLRTILIWTIGSIPLLIVVAAPTAQMIHWMFYLREASFYQLGGHLITTVVLTAGTAVAGMTVAILGAYGRLVVVPAWTGPLRYLAPLGYALPGAVLALAVMAAGGAGLLSSGLGLFLALVIRFTGVGLPPLASASRQGGKSLVEASLVMGRSPLNALKTVILPVWAPAAAGAACLMAVDLLKELPMTIALRPFNFHTLATRTFEMVQNEIPADAAPSGLLLVLLAWAAAWGGQKLLGRRRRNHADHP